MRIYDKYSHLKVMRDKEKILLATTCLFGGMVLGFLIAPIKKGFEIGNNSGNNYFPENKQEDNKKIEPEESTSDSINTY